MFWLLLIAYVDSNPIFATMPELSVWVIQIAPKKCQFSCEAMLNWKKTQFFGLRNIDTQVNGYFWSMWRMLLPNLVTLIWWLPQPTMDICVSDHLWQNDVHTIHCEVLGYRRKRSSTSCWDNDGAAMCSENGLMQTHASVYLVASIIGSEIYIA